MNAEAIPPDTHRFDPRQAKERVGNEYIAIATSTYYPTWQEVAMEKTADQLRGDLSIEAFRLAVEKGFQITVIDGGSSNEFITRFTGLGISVISQPERGMSGRRHQAFREAAVLPKAEVITWLEPEKVSMVKLLEQAAQPILEGRADVVVPNRRESSYQTYPMQQATSEKRFNHWYNVVLRKIGLRTSNDPELDVAFGPRLFRNNPELLKIFTRTYTLKPNSRLAERVKPDAYSNATFFPIMIGLEQGYRVESVPVNYVHPPQQTMFETGKPEFEEKRRRQKRDIVADAIQLARWIIQNPKKPSELLLVTDESELPR